MKRKRDEHVIITKEIFIPEDIVKKIVLTFLTLKHDKLSTYGTTINAERCTVGYFYDILQKNIRLINKQFYRCSSLNDEDVFLYFLRLICKKTNSSPESIALTINNAYSKKYLEINNYGCTLASKNNGIEELKKLIPQLDFGYFTDLLHQNILFYSASCF
jgi:hypothetical protein